MVRFLTGNPGRLFYAEAVPTLHINLTARDSRFRPFRARCRAFAFELDNALPFASFALLQTPKKYRSIVRSRTLRSEMPWDAFDESVVADCLQKLASRYPEHLSWSWAP
jgi:hypothetical protein